MTDEGKYQATLQSVRALYVDVGTHISELAEQREVLKKAYEREFNRANARAEEVTKVERDRDMYVKAWVRTLGGAPYPKAHLIDALVGTTERYMAQRAELINVVKAAGLMHKVPSVWPDATAPSSPTMPEEVTKTTAQEHLMLSPEEIHAIKLLLQTKLQGSVIHYLPSSMNGNLCGTGSSGRAEGDWSFVTCTECLKSRP